MREDVGEAQQQWRVQAAPLQRLHDLQHVHGVAACGKRDRGLRCAFGPMLLCRSASRRCRVQYSRVAPLGIDMGMGRLEQSPYRSPSSRAPEGAANPTHRSHGAARRAGRDPRRGNRGIPSRRRCRAPPSPAGPTLGLAQLSQHEIRRALPPASLPLPEKPARKCDLHSFWQNSRPPGYRHRC